MVDYQKLIYFCVLGVCFHIIGIVCTYIKMYGCDYMWKCNDTKCLCMQLITRNVTIISIFTVIFIVCSFWESEKAFNHFSFAGTITSIILSVLAIMMTINSEEKNERMKGSIDNAITVIQSSSNTMSEYNKKVEQISDKVDEIKKISAELANISSMNDEIRKYQKEVLKRVVHIDTSFKNMSIDKNNISLINFESQEELKSE